MSKKTSPQSRPQRRPRTRSPQTQRDTGTAVSAAAVERSRNRRRESNAPVPTAFTGRLRRFLPTVLVPNVVVVLSVIVVALAILMLSSSEMAALSATIAQLWLGFNLVPLQVGGTTVGLLPLLPAMGLVWLLSRQIHRSVRTRVSIADLAVLYGLVLLAPLILSGIAMGMLWDASAVYEVEPPRLLDMLPRVILLHSVAMFIGMGSKLWRALCRHYGLPEALVANARSALRFLSYLLVAALLVLVLAIALGWRRQLEIAEIYNSGGAVVALIFVSLLYLPNALIGVGAVLVGAEFHIGEASVSLFSIHHTPLPPMPLVAAIPAESIPGLYALLVIPALIAGYLAYRANPTLISASTTGIFAALFTAIAGYLAQGALGEFGPSGPMVWLSSALVLVWVALAGLTTALLLKLVERRQRKAVEAALYAGDPEEDEYEAEFEDVAEETDEDAEDTTSEDPAESEEIAEEVAAAEDDAAPVAEEETESEESAAEDTADSVYIEEPEEAPIPAEDETGDEGETGEDAASQSGGEEAEEPTESGSLPTPEDHNEGAGPTKG